MAQATLGASNVPPTMRDRRGFVYEPALGPKLRALLFLVFVSFAVLGATGVYLLAVHGLEWIFKKVYESPFSLWMLIVHLGVGVVILVPFLVFGVTHWATARKRRNRRAVRLGLGLFWMGIVVCVTGLALIQLFDQFQLPSDSLVRQAMWWLHLVSPIAAVVLYILHRQAGPAIQWKYSKAWGVGVGLFVAGMAVMHLQDPRKWNEVGPREGEQYFRPAETRTATGNFIPADVLMMDSYCLKCHADVYQGWFHSAHHFSSFNNPAYLFSVRNTRKVSMERDGTPRASRWCAGCHDPVPFLSGKFDDPHYDDVNDPTANAGITCTVCHAMTHINSTVGNGAYTLENPVHYPGAQSENPFMQWLNNQLIKAKPDLHKKTFLKDFHRSAEFCSTCHKVSIPMPVTDYKDFLRGQNHYDTYRLSGVSGHGARSFYYPAEAKTRCAECHMPLLPSNDRGSGLFDDSGQRKVHDHLFPGGNTGLPFLASLQPRNREHVEGLQRTIQAQADFLRGTDPEGKDRKVRIDLFGIKEGGSVDGRLIAPLRPELPQLEKGKSYLVEVVIRTVNLGHPFTQGTVDSNEVWVDFEARSGNRILGRSGGMTGPDMGRVDDWAHYLNVLMLSRHGERVNRRNPEDIFTPLYDHQIPPGAAQVVHYKLLMPEDDLKDPVELRVRVRYRKFDFEYMSLVHGGDDKVPPLPIVDLCEDRVVLPVAGGKPVVRNQTSPIKPAWQRWNDYGIGLYLEGGVGQKRGELARAEEAFELLVKHPDPAAHAHGYVNLARVYKDTSRLDKAALALNQARACDPPAPWWTVAWLTGQVNLLNGHFDEAIASFEQVLDPARQPRERKFDFTIDDEVINDLGRALSTRSQLEKADLGERDRFLLQAIRWFERTLELDSENVDAHYQLYQAYARMSEGRWKAGPAAAEESELETLANTLTDSKQPVPTRLETASRMVAGIDRMGARPQERNHPKLALLTLLLTPCRTAFQQTEDQDLRAAMAVVLSRIHRELHALYVPDANARGRAVAAYRKDHPAADHASQAVVTYDLNRPGAPGLK